MEHRFSRRALLGGAVAIGAVAAGGAGVAFAATDTGAAAAAPSRAGKLPLIGPVGGDRLHVMSFNIRTGVDAGARSWEARLPRIDKLITAEQPAVIGAQEGRIWQVRQLKDALPGYGAVWRGRDKDGSGETCAVFYRKDRLEKLDEGHRWLSTTPTVPGSQSWGAKFPRMMTWVRLRDKETNRQFFLVNAHFDHYSALARRKSAQLVRDWVKQRQHPAVITGDFNTGAGSRPHHTLIAGDFHDTWNHEDKRITPTFGTANGWNPVPRRGGRRIDWILGTKAVAVHKTGINTWVTKHDNTPSDHWPVQAVVSLKP